jgi:mycothiol synthase
MNIESTPIRQYHRKDRELLVRFWAEVAKLEGSHGHVSVRELIDILDRPNHFPEKNLFIAENKGDIIGYIDVIPELGIGRVVLQYLVHPGYRRKGIAEKLVEQAVDWAGKSEAKKAHTNIPKDDKAGRRLFSKMGFQCIRQFLELSLDLSKIRLSKIAGSDYPCRSMMEGEEEKLTRLQNHSFMDTWGFNPNTTEEVRYRIRLPKASPKDITFCFDGVEPIGYCWVRLDTLRDQGLDGVRGRIHMLGVVPDYRGNGVGKKVLLLGLNQLKNRGVPIVDLTVDGGNEAACALYRSVGFEVHTSSLWYQKNL